MIRTLDRMVLGTFFKLFAVVIVAVPPLFILGNFTEQSDSFLDRGLSRAEVGLSYLYKVPEYLWFSFPIAALVATVFTIYTMTQHREIVAAKAGGISFHRVVAPLIVAGLLLTGAALGVSELVPRGNAMAARIQRAEGPNRTWRSDFVYRSENGLDWQVGRLTADNGRMSDVVVERRPSADQIGFHVSAAEAAWSEDGGWVLVQGYLRTLLPDSTEHSMGFDRLVMPALTERPNDLLEKPREPEEMTRAEIDRITGILERSGGDPQEWLVRRGQMIALPIAVFVIILFAAPLATSNKRGGAAYGVGISLVTVITFTMALKVAEALGNAGAISPWAAAWTPNILCAAIAVFLLARVRT